MSEIKRKKIRFNRRKFRIKKKLKSKDGILRMCITRSNRNLSVQIIDDRKFHTLVGFSTVSGEFSDAKSNKNIESAKKLGKMIAEKALEKGIKKVVFDRNGYLYHGKIKAFAESAREHGLEF